MKRKAKLALTAALALVFLVSGGGALLRLLDYRGGAADYSEAERLAELPEFGQVQASSAPDGPPAPDRLSPADEGPEDPAARFEQAMRELDLAPLREENPDVIGWIVIPDTQISYPVVQGTDNQYYLDHTWKGVRRAVGAIFLECRNSREFSDFNTIVYGHRMSDSSMFHTLLSYGRQEFWQAHPTVYIAGDGVCRRYEIFAAYEASTTGETYRLQFAGDGERQAFLDHCLERSAIDTGIVPGTDGHILTLSTCTDAGSRTARWVVHGVLAE